MTLIFIVILCIFSSCLAEDWTVYIYTGNERFAGTDSNVYIRLFNSNGDGSDEVQLTHDNWIPENHDFPVRNLFEMGAREKFRVQTTYLGSVAKIRIRRNNFPTLQANWLLDQVIVERNRDGAKYIFKCNCWLRKANPSIIISVLPDPNTNNKNKTNDSLSKINQIFVIILVILITLLICIFCCINQYRRRRRYPSLSLTSTSEQTQQEPSLLDTYNPESPRPSSPSSGPQFWMNTIRQWKNFRDTLPTYIHPRTAQPPTGATMTPTITAATDEPPAYEDLYPNATTPINTALTSNL